MLPGLSSYLPASFTEKCCMPYGNYGSPAVLNPPPPPPPPPGGGPPPPTPRFVTPLCPQLALSCDVQILHDVHLRQLFLKILHCAMHACMPQPMANRHATCPHSWLLHNSLSCITLGCDTEWGIEGCQVPFHNSCLWIYTIRSHNAEVLFFQILHSPSMRTHRHLLVQIGCRLLLKVVPFRAASQAMHFNLASPVQNPHDLLGFCVCRCRHSFLRSPSTRCHFTVRPRSGPS